MEIKQVKNYKHFADFLKTKTSCGITIKIIGNNHYHYQMNKDGISLGVLCVDNGIGSFAPFATLENVTNDQYINVCYMPMLDDLINVFNVLSEIFVCDEEVWNKFIYSIYKTVLDWQNIISMIPLDNKKE